MSLAPSGSVAETVIFTLTGLLFGGQSWAGFAVTDVIAGDD